MVTLLPKVRSFGEEFGEAIGGGLGQGYQQGREESRKMAELARENAEIKEATGIDLSGQTDPEMRKASFIEQLRGQQRSQEKPLNPLQEAQTKLAEAKIGQIQSQKDIFNRLTGNKTTKELSGSKETFPEQEIKDLSKQEHDILSEMSEENLNQLAAFSGQLGEEGIIGNIAKNELDKRKEEQKNRTAKEKQYFKFNEPKLSEIAGKQRNLQLEGARLDRLDELFKEKEKFPSSFTAALFTKEGALNDIAYSQLTPEAQESVKLIIDMTSGIKDTYGARVTNFDLQTYLRKLPSLLNTPEGKERIIRDLKSINHINQLYNQGIQNIFDEAGGSDKIAFSDAEKRFTKKYGKEIDSLLKEFVTPSQKKFKSFPEPSKYLGRKVKNDETGEIFISDGKEWKLFKE